MKRNCVFVIEIGIIKAESDEISYWEVWSSFNTQQEARKELKRMLEKRPPWVTTGFFRSTTRIVKYESVKERG